MLYVELFVPVSLKIENQSDLAPSSRPTWFLSPKKRFMTLKVQRVFMMNIKV